MRKPANAGGFTLVELLIVMTTISILAAIMVPNFIHARDKGYLDACSANLKNVANAMEMYATENAGRYATDLALLTPRYIQSIPTCPAVSQATFQVVTTAMPDGYTISCMGTNHLRAGDDENCPYFDSLSGLNDQQDSLGSAAIPNAVAQWIDPGALTTAALLIGFYTSFP